jgi:hypothetical protein
MMFINLYREFFAAAPGLRRSMLGINAKRFDEKYRYIQLQRSRCNSRSGSRRSSISGSFENLNMSSLDNDVIDEDTRSTGGLADNTYHKVILVNISA